MGLRTMVFRGSRNSCIGREVFGSAQASLSTPARPGYDAAAHRTSKQALTLLNVKRAIYLLLSHLLRAWPKNRMIQRVNVAIQGLSVHHVQIIPIGINIGQP